MYINVELVIIFSVLDFFLAYLSVGYYLSVVVWFCITH